MVIFLCLSIADSHYLSNIPECEVEVNLYEKYFKLPIQNNYLNYEKALLKYVGFISDEELKNISKLFQ